MYGLIYLYVLHFSRQNKNTTPPANTNQSGTAMEAAETLIAMKHTQDQITQKENVQPVLTEKINIIENIKLK